MVSLYNTFLGWLVLKTSRSWYKIHLTCRVVKGYIAQLVFAEYVSVEQQKDESDSLIIHPEKRTASIIEHAKASLDVYKTKYECLSNQRITGVDEMHTGK